MGISLTQTSLMMTSTLSTFENLFKPVHQLFQNGDTVLKVINVHLNCTYSNGTEWCATLGNSLGTRTLFSTLEKIPSTDEEVFEFFKNEINSPANPDEEHEAVLTTEELAHFRDPKGLRFLPIDSPEVQNLLQEWRSDFQEESTRMVDEIEIPALITIMEYLSRYKHCKIPCRIEVIYADKLKLKEEKQASFSETFLSPG